MHSVRFQLALLFTRDLLYVCTNYFATIQYGIRAVKIFWIDELGQGAVYQVGPGFADRRPLWFMNDGGAPERSLFTFYFQQELHILTVANLCRTFVQLRRISYVAPGSIVPVIRSDIGICPGVWKRTSGKTLNTG